MVFGQMMDQRNGPAVVEVLEAADRAMRKAKENADDADKTKKSAPINVISVPF